MALIVILLVTGFEVHDRCVFLGFDEAVDVHNYVGLSWLIAFIFFVFWVFTTGEWRRCVPTTKRMFSVIRYYGWGIFRGETHPFPKRKEAKHNPLQRLAYLSLVASCCPCKCFRVSCTGGIIPGKRGGSGFLSLQWVAVVHVAGAFAILSFLIGHIYMTTTGHSLMAHIKAMITGWEEVVDERKSKRVGKSPAQGVVKSSWHCPGLGLGLPVKSPGRFLPLRRWRTSMAGGVRRR